MENTDATDAARELADAEGIDLDEVEGSGEGGRVLKSDIEQLTEDDGLTPIRGEFGGNTYWSCPADGCATDDWSRLVIEAHIRKRHGGR